MEISSSMQAIAIKVSPSSKYGIATSTYFIGLDIGIGFGPSLLDYLQVQSRILKFISLWLL